jgi:hypothetical protein
MKKVVDNGRQAGKAPPNPEQSTTPYAELAEAWRGAMGPWLSWLGILESAMRSRTAPLVENATKMMGRPERMFENLGAFSEGLRRMVELPQFADLPDIGSAFPSFEPVIELMGVTQQYLSVAMPIWIEACKRFEAEAARQRDKGEKLDSGSGALELWNNTLDRTLMEFNRSSEFAELQQRYLRGGIRQKLETRRYFERLAKAVDNPSRSELDDVYRRLHELRREVASLRRKLKAADMASATGNTPPATFGPVVGNRRKPRSSHI